MNMARILNKHKQTNAPLKRKVFVGISGGVDSAVAAALLKAKDYDVTGIFLREYDLSLPSAFGDTLHCTQEGDRQSALAVAAALDIPFQEWDFRKAYERSVVRYMIREYARGRTPNPDIMCNSVIKFGLFLERALKEGADYIATGHYARLLCNPERGGDSRRPRDAWDSSFSVRNNVRLLQARDKNKDQTYFLATLGQEQLRRCLFPIGGLIKTEVRVHAKKIGLPNWNRKDSQGVCFIGKLSMKDFLKASIKSKKGALMTRDGRRVGTHDGAAYVTIGQRHGLGFDGGGATYYVVGKDMKKNIVYVDQKKQSSALYQKELTCMKVSWISGQEPSFPLRCTARTRYRQKLQKCLVISFRAERGIPNHARTTGSLDKLGMRNMVRVAFDAPTSAITPGQFVVFYKGRECLGNGIID
jgi:tRNA-specific 2-thiouridylase